MSLLDIIKNLFCSKSSEQSETSTQAAEVVSQAEVNPEPVAETKVTSDEQKIPEDSTLRRHYLANQAAQKQPKYVEPAAPIVEPEPVIAEVAEEKPVETALKLQVPQDSTLKRHFIAGLKADIESNMPARPSDATLRLQYDTEVQAELDKLLS